LDNQADQWQPFVIFINLAIPARGAIFPFLIQWQSCRTPNDFRDWQDFNVLPGPDREVFRSGGGGDRRQAQFSNLVIVVSR